MVAIIVTGYERPSSRWNSNLLQQSKCDLNSTNDVLHEHTKHIEIYCHFIQYYLLHGTVHLVSTLLIDLIVDVFTKAHLQKCFQDLLQISVGFFYVTLNLRGC